ncbi:competence type IV pilus ATPase ComGA [Vagococcus zengguangii]|uniref:Secretion system protein E n=1 Tax=Vagococcus zengguangii TaxID=2571750 RepID=A0A4D7CNS7_9ENTE|nr:competence type IV pilus ATPase ComGA [Vagococcus zengguangii]QCI85728.1 secretion system protein E [Vagococcus zengguangii]TLG81669.1 secretion system protein E [Vagococcus zengguangii]
MKDLMLELFEQAVRKQASDLYIFPSKTEYELTLRCQNQKELLKTLSFEEAEKFILYLKYLGNMDVGERRKIQLGSAVVTLSTGPARHIRLSSVGDYQNRESLVVRFLNDLENERDFRVVNTEAYQKIQTLMAGKGLFVFSGATGSGKTTMMYHLAREFALAGQQVITIEDPVELAMPMFLQLQVNEKIELNYQRLIQLCLRHRPDILVIGEIRDSQTAHAVVRAALTGHTVLTTVHAMDTINVVTRLLELGVSTHDLKQVLKVVVFQTMTVLEQEETELEGKEGVLYQAVELELLRLDAAYWQRRDVGEKR